jgi:hypothetical protein
MGFVEGRVAGTLAEMTPVLAILLASALFGSGGMVASELWLRPRVGEDRMVAVAFAIPAAVFAAVGAGFAAWVDVAASAPLWASSLLCLSAGWAFWPSRRRAWSRFEQQFWAHVRLSRDPS